MTGNKEMEDQSGRFSIVNWIGMASAAWFVLAFAYEFGFFLVFGLEHFTRLGAYQHLVHASQYLPVMLVIWGFSWLREQAKSKDDEKQPVAQKPLGKEVGIWDKIKNTTYSVIAIGIFLIMVLIGLMPMEFFILTVAFMVWVFYGQHHLNSFVEKADLDRFSLVLVRNAPFFLLLPMVGGIWIADDLFEANAETFVIETTDGEVVPASISGIFESGILYVNDGIPGFMEGHKVSGSINCGKRRLGLLLRPTDKDPSLGSKHQKLCSYLKKDEEN